VRVFQKEERGGQGEGAERSGEERVRRQAAQKGVDVTTRGAVNASKARNAHEARNGGRRKSKKFRRGRTDDRSEGERKEERREGEKEIDSKGALRCRESLTKEREDYKQWGGEVRKKFGRI